MKLERTPAAYDQWYSTPRGAWMGEAEARWLLRAGRLGRGVSVLDAGCGSGWFSRRFAAAGCDIVAVDRDCAGLRFARTQDAGARYLPADMAALPFADNSFDAVTAVTSLCFVADQERVLKELIRVARKRVLLGLLHRRSLLCLRKRDRGSYAGAHWHTRREIRRLLQGLPEISHVRTQTLLFWPGNPVLGRVLERVPGLAPAFGGFLAVELVVKKECVPRTNIKGIDRINRIKQDLQD